MRGQNLSRYRSVGLTLVTVGLVGLAVALPVAALHAASDRFNKIVGWSTILAFSVAAAGFALILADRYRRPAATSPEALNQAADQLAEQVLGEEGVQRARLLGTDAVTVTAANVGFERADQLVEFEEPSTGRTGDLNTIAEFYRKETSRRLVILGAPGAGKTVLALELLVRLLEQRRGSITAIEPVPIRLSLPAWNIDQPFTEWLAAQLSARYGLADEVAKKLVATGRILPVLDGLDEMDPENGTPARAADAVSNLDEYINGTSGAALVITCRTAEYRRIGTSIQPAATIRIRPLSTEQVIDYLHREVRNRVGQAKWDSWDGLIRQLEDRKDRRVLDLLQTPWRLVLAVTFYRDGGSPGDLLPSTSENSQQYSARASGILLNAFVPARTRIFGRGTYTPEQTRSWLINVAGYLSARANAGLSGSDIVLTRCWPIAGADRVRRWHTTIAVIVTIFTSAVVAVLRNGGISHSIANVHYYLTKFPSLPRDFLVPGLSVIFIIFVLPWFAARRVRDTSIQPMQVNVQQLRTSQGRKRLAGGLALGLALGLAFGLAAGFAAGLAFGLAAGLVVGLVIGLVAGLAFGLVIGLEPSEDAAAGDPRDGLRSDLAAALVAGLAIAVVTGLAAEFSGYRLGLGFGLGFGLGLGAGLVVGLVFISVTSCRYLIAISIAGSTRLLPLRFAKFLNWAYKAGILRISGNAYQFRHTELRDWLQLRQINQQQE